MVIYYAVVIDLTEDMVTTYIKGNLKEVKNFISGFRYRNEKIIMFRLHGNNSLTSVAKQRAVNVKEFDLNVFNYSE